MNDHADPSLYTVLERLAARRGITITEAIRGAVALALVVDEAMDAGHQVLLRRHDDGHTELVVVKGE